MTKYTVVEPLFQHSLSRVSLARVSYWHSGCHPWYCVNNNEAIML